MMGADKSEVPKAGQQAKNSNISHCDLRQNSLFTKESSFSLLRVSAQEQTHPISKGMTPKVN